MSLDFGGTTGSDPTLETVGIDVQGVTGRSYAATSEYSLPSTVGQVDANMTGAVTINNGVPDNVTNPERSDGITVSGILAGVTSTADTALNLFGKAYSLYSTAQNANYSAKIAEQQRALTFNGQQAAIDLQTTRNAAALKIGQLNAEKAVADAQAKTVSGAAGFVKAPGFQLTAGVVAAAFVGFLLLKKEKIV